MLIAALLWIGFLFTFTAFGLATLAGLLDQ